MEENISPNETRPSRIRQLYRGNSPTKFLSKKYLPAFVLIVIVIIVILIGVKVISGSSSSSDNQNPQNVQIEKPLATANINKTFEFPIKNDKGNVVGKLTYVAQTGELDRQVIIQGKVATAITGRMFLVLNLKLVNNQDKGVTINTRDYVRLSVNGDTKEMLAPSIYNDPVSVQPISTQFARLGFAVNTTDKNFMLQVGEIDGKKEMIKLNFK